MTFKLPDSLVKMKKDLFDSKILMQNNFCQIFENFNVRLPAHGVKILHLRQRIILRQLNCYPMTLAHIRALSRSTTLHHNTHTKKNISMKGQDFCPYLLPTPITSMNSDVAYNVIIKILDCRDGEYSDERHGCCDRS